MSLSLMSSLSLICLSVSLWTSGIPSVEAAAPERQTNSASGLVTGVIGAPTTVGAGAPRVLSLGDTLSTAQPLRTGLDETVEILWDHHAVIQVHPKSAVLIQETTPGVTQIHLTGGSVRVALAYGSRPSDIVTVHTPTSRVFTRGGIVEVDVLPSTPTLLSRVGAVFGGGAGAAPPSLLEAVRVLEGQAGIEPLNVSRPSQMLDEGLQARIAAGTVEQTSDLPVSAGRRGGLAATDRRQATPGPLTQNIVRVHVNHALEVERLMSASASSLDQTDKAAGTDIKGTIVATSLGVPTTSFAQASGSAGSVTGGGSPAPAVSTPLPTLPPVQTPTLTTLVPNQSGGANSRSIINSVLSDGKNKDNGKRKGKGH